MMRYFVIDTEEDEFVGTIDCRNTDADILQALEDSDYIDCAEDCTLKTDSNGSAEVTEDDELILKLSLTDPTADDDDEDDADFEDEEDEDD
jgi:hypothetical protein